MRAGGGAGGAAVVAVDRNLGAPVVHSRLWDEVRIGPLLHRGRLPWHTPVEPKCRLPAAAPELRPLVGLDLVALCAAYISNVQYQEKKRETNQQ